jgi:sialic acid synthase SpsE
MNDFYLGSVLVNKEKPPVVIAEIGINHGGSIKTAFDMIDAAARAGVEIVKHQTHVIDDEMSSIAKTIIPGNADRSIYEIMRECALDEVEETELKQYIESKGMIFLSTPFSRAAAERLAKMDVSAFKIGSGECNNHPLLNFIASLKKPMLISTGMNTLESVEKTVNIVSAHNVPLALMHTTNLYPTPNHLVRLGAMQQMMKRFPNIPIGLSDHTTSNHACYAATAMGAQLLERHFTDHMKREGPDIICSMDEHACKELINGTDIIHSMLGGKKVPAPEEQVTIDFAFATVVVIKSIEVGEVLSEENIWVKRPGTGGIKAEHYADILGKKAKKKLHVDQHLEYSDFE